MNPSAARQSHLGRFVDEVDFELRVRSDPDGVAAAEGVEVEFVRRLAAIDSRRVAAFRASRVHKGALRQGHNKPGRLGW